MLTAERSNEASLRAYVEEKFDKLGIEIVELAERNRGVITLVLRLPSWADRATRHDAIRVLSDFEARQEQAVTTSAAFVWGEPDGDDD